MSLYSSLTQVLAPYAAKLNGLLTGWDGTTYSSPGEAVRQQIADLHVLIGDEPGTAIQGEAVSYDGTESGLTATTVQAAIDESAAALSSTNERLDDFYSLNSGDYVFPKIIDNETVNATTGVISADSRYERTDYIPTSDFTIGLRIRNNRTAGNLYAVFYNANKEYVGYFTLPAGMVSSVTIPNDASYFILYAPKANGGVKTELTVFGFAKQEYEYFSEKIDSLILPTPQTYSCVNGHSIIPLRVIVGHTYTMLNETGANISINSCNENGTRIEQMAYQFAPNVIRNFVATRKAEYIDIYLLAESGNVTVYDSSGNMGNILDATVKELEEVKGKIHAKEERPSTGYEVFSVNVNCHDYTENADDGVAMYADYGAIAFPTNYSPSSDPTKLIILCGGNAERIKANTNPLSFHGWEYYLGKGYAVMDMNGMPADWATAMEFPLTDKHLCNKYLIGSYKSGYEYVTSKYNIDNTQVFVSGISMGGGASALIVQSGILPVVAHCMFCPALSVYKQDYMKPWNNALNQKKTIAGQWGFDNWDTTETFDQSYFLANISKISGFDNLLIHTIGDFDSANANYGNQAEADAYNAMKKFYPVPVKLWHCEDDPTVLVRYSEFFVNMIKNAGGQAWLRTFETGGHTGGWSSGSVSDTTIDGEAITTSIPFYESVLFFKRFG